MEDLKRVVEAFNPSEFETYADTTFGMTNDYHDIQGRDIEIVNRYHGTGATRSILSNRISYFFDLRGPSVSLDTACSSSLAALHFAVQSLRNGESNSSIVGGVNLIFDSVPYVSESKLHMLSPTSRSSMWSESADGYARGEGVSALMLKTLSQAIVDGDHIECVIRETGMNQDGRTTGLTMPSGEAQAALIRDTYLRAGLDLRKRSDRPQYFEAHGTGTLAGDPQEARGIYDAFFDDLVVDADHEPAANHEKLYCGSIKTVVGHLEGCAGLAGLLKASLAVQHGVIPPNLLFDSLNPEIEPFYHRLEVPLKQIPWPECNSIRRASVNSFGFGGTNCHAIIEQYQPPTPTPSQPSAAEDFFAGPLLLSAGTGSSLAASIDHLANLLEKEDSHLRVEDLAFFTQSRRTTFQQRICFPGGTKSSLIEALRAASHSTAASDIGTRAPAKLKWTTPGVLGIFTGQGAQWATMGREMLNCHTFSKSIQACEAAIQSLPDAPTWSLALELAQEQSKSRLHEAALSQPLCTAIQIALVDTLAAAGVSFRGVVGHSSGEIAATYAAGLLSAEDAMRVAYYRGVHAHLAQGAQGQQGAMLAVGLGIDDAEDLCDSKPFNGRLSVAASNSPTSTTLSGDEDAIQSAKDLLEREGTFARLLKVDTAYHSSHMISCAEPYRDSLKACKIQVLPQNDQCVWISSVHGHAEMLDFPEDLGALADDYWVQNMCKPVLFSEAVECSLWRAGPFDLALEVGAHPALKGPAQQTITAVLGATANLPYTATLQRGRNDVTAFSASLGSLWATLGTWINFDGWRKAYLGPNAPPTVAALKAMASYSWSHDQVYWKESRLSSRHRLAERPPHELLGRRAADDSENEMRWRNIMKVNELSWIRGHVFQRAILFPTIGYVAMAIEAAAEIAGADRIRLIEIRDLVIPRALVLEDNHNGVDTMFSVRRQPTECDTTIETDFTCHSSVNNGALEKNCGGRLIIELFSPHDEKNAESHSLLPARCPPRSGTTSIEGEAYYRAILNTTGLDYQGLFRGMKRIQRTLGFSTAQASWPVEDVGSKYILHPGLLDVALQAILGAFANPTRIPIRGSFLPAAMSRLVFDPHARTVTDDGKEVVFESDCFLTNNTPCSFEGDIHVFGPSGQCLLQVEGFRMDNWIEPDAKEDRPVFSRLDYQPDMFYGNGDNLAELYPDAAEQKLIEAINRASFYYLRNFFSTASESQVANWTWDRQAFFKAVQIVLQKTAEGTHPVAKPAWLKDTADLMEQYKQTPDFRDQADMKAIHVAGDHLAKVMAGDERPLEVYLRENVWAPLYSHGRYQIRLNRTIADLVRTFAHRYPRAKYLELGAGSGGTTLSVLEQVGDAVGEYTFTDISAGFFEKAREKLARTDAAVADRVAYKVLDLERDPLEQGFEEGSQDVIIAANVLHATADLKKAVQSVRRLLKPGGYLFMLEVTGEYLEGLLLMGPLEGWWLGNREGTASQPGLTLQAWDDLLRETGFTGVDGHQSDVPSSTTQAVSVVVTQAIDMRVEMLREPLEFLDDLPVSDQILIIGGQSMAMAKTIRTISQHVARFAGRVQVVQSVDKIGPAMLNAPTAVIALCDLERPFFADPITDARLKQLQSLFANATDVLWVTTGHLDEKDPSAAMMIGLCRTIVIELDSINFQFLNTTSKSPRQSEARFIVEAFVRLNLGASDAFNASTILWSVEPELTLTSEEEVLIPRLKPDVERNNRLNSAIRHITKTVSSNDMATKRYIATTHEGHVQLEEDSPWLIDTDRRDLQANHTVKLRVTSSITLPHSSSAVLVTGLDQDDKPVLGITDAHSSTASVPAASALYLNSATPYTAQQLRVCAQLILAQQVLAAIPPRASLKEPKVVIHGASAGLVGVIRQLAGKERHLVFTQSTANKEPTASDSVRLHPQSSTYILRRALPSKIGFLVTLARDDSVAGKLLAIFPGSAFDMDALLLQGKGMPLAGLDNLIPHACTDVSIKENLGDVEQPAILAHALPDLPASSLEYPAVVNWATNDDTPLVITVNPIHGRGMFSPDKTYLMVSLVSTLGRSICRWMVENGARHIALASRSAKIDPQWLEEMVHFGADIRIFKMDVSLKSSVQSTVATIRAEMPPIAGVANAALVLRDGLFLDMEAEDMTEVLAPKTYGSLHLHEEFQDPSLDFFVLFSTLSCVIGNAGQSNYDAASLYQVMLAKQRRLKGLPASVMEVGCVADVGYVAERGQSLFDKLARTMKLPLSESDVHQIFAEALAASPIRDGEIVDSTTAEIVSGMGHYTYSANTPSEAHPPWFTNLLASHYVREERGTSVVAGGADADHLSVATRLDATTSEEAAAAFLTQALAERVENMLQMSANSFKVDASLLDVGIDSLLAVELRTWFLKEIHVDVPVLKILSGESGEAIAQFAAGQWYNEKGKTATETPSGAADAPIATPSAESEKEGSAGAMSSDLKRSPSPSSSDTEDSSLATSVSNLALDSKKENPEGEDALPPSEDLRSTAPMTHAQARMWVADHMSSNRNQNNNLLTYDLRGFVNVARLRRAVATVVGHHSGLATCFFQDAANTPRQGVLENPRDCFRQLYATTVKSDRIDVVARTQDELRTRKWRLQRGEALEIILISHTDDQHTLLIGYHHIAMDGSAWRTFFRDLHMAYQGVPLQAPGKSLLDVATEEAKQVAGTLHASWKRQFSPAPEPFPLLPFASVKTRPSLEGFSNHMSLKELDESTANRIIAISRSLGVTSVNFYLAAVQSLLSRLSNTEGDICIGVTDAGRDEETGETIGFFLNLLPIRLDTTSKPFGKLVQYVSQMYREARQHSNVAFDAILDGAGVQRDSTCTPLFQVGFDVRHGQSGDIPLGNCQMKILESDDSALPYDLAFCAIPMPTGPSYIQVVTRTDLYSQEATELLAQMYVTLLESTVRSSAIDTPSEHLQIYPDAGIHRSLELGTPKLDVLEHWPNTMTEMVERSSRNNPANIAIKDVCGSLTYAELFKDTMSLASPLLTYRGHRVAVLCEPQRDWVVAMLAVFRVGAAFVSLDATLPPARLVNIMRACEPSIVLCHTATADLAADVARESGYLVEVLSLRDSLTTFSLTEHLLTKNPNTSASNSVENFEDPSKASLILCTSGSTGVPKAILLSSRGIVNYLANQTKVHGAEKGEVILQQSNLGFDMSFAETLFSLAHGCTLVIVPQASRGDPVAVTDLMAAEKVSITFACPTEYMMWVRYCRETLTRCNRWRRANSGGEKVPEALHREMAKLECCPVFSDAYGPTEVSMCATVQHDDILLCKDQLAPFATSVGQPVDNVGVFIIDSSGSLCPPGIPGEVCITGAGLALGYVDANATAQSFIEGVEIDCGKGNTVSVGIMYKTGDRGVWRKDGTLGFLDRLGSDTFVKIRGLRVDLGDVEHAILWEGSHIISDVVVTFYQQGDDSYLVAHVVPASQEETMIRKDGLRSLETPLEEFMQSLTLPRHMKPVRVVILEKIPNNANGKVDRMALSKNVLPPRELALLQHDNAAIRITTLKQVEMHLLWGHVLSRTDIPRQVDVDFWAMGGSSLHLVQLQAAIRKDMLVSVSIRDMFMHSTLGSMADLVADRTSGLTDGTPINWDQETGLADDLRCNLRSPVAGQPSLLASCGELLLTGADAFLGSHILQALLRNPSVRRVHCIAVPSLMRLPAGVDVSRAKVYVGSSIHQDNFGLSEDTIATLMDSVDRIIMAGSHGHCLNNYSSLRQTNVVSTKTLATWAARRRVPLHFISSSRVTLLPKNSEAALPPISVKAYLPKTDGSEGFTASKWAGEVFLERLAAESGDTGSGFPITIHRPCALIGEEAPSDDSLNAILKYSALMNCVPLVSSSPGTPGAPVTGYFDFAAVAEVATSIAEAAIQAEQPPVLRFRHHSGGAKVRPSEFKGYMERSHSKTFEELELEEWLAKALDLGLEPMIAIYLRAVVQSGEEMVFPYMGTPSSESGGSLQWRHWAVV